MNRATIGLGTLLLSLVACHSASGPNSSPTTPVTQNPQAEMCAGHAFFLGQVNSTAEPIQYAYWTESPDSSWAILEASEFLSFDSSHGTPALHDTISDFAYFSHSSQGWSLAPGSKRVTSHDTVALVGIVNDLHATSDSILVGWSAGDGGMIYYLKKLN